MTMNTMEIIGALYCQAFEVQRDLDIEQDRSNNLLRNFEDLQKVHKERLIDLDAAEATMGGLNQQIEAKEQKITELEQRIIALQAKYDEFEKTVVAERSASLSEEFATGQGLEADLENMRDHLRDTEDQLTKSQGECAELRAQIKELKAQARQADDNRLEDEKRKQSAQAKELAGARKKLLEVTKELEAIKAAGNPVIQETNAAKLEKERDRLTRRVERQKNDLSVAFRHLHKAVAAYENDPEKSFSWIEKAMKLLSKEAAGK